MGPEHQARWVSPQKAIELRKTGQLSGALLLNTFTGFILIEPAGGKLGDGAVLSSRDADQELQTVWCPGPKATTREARKRLGLDGAAVMVTDKGKGVRKPSNAGW